MKLSFSPISSCGDLFIVTTAVAIAFGATPWTLALSHPVGVLANTRQQFPPILIQTPVKVEYTVGRVSAGNLNGKDFFELLNKENLPEKKSDNPAPVPGSPGGSR